MSEEEILNCRELILCEHCKRPFNNSNLQPKFLACKHYFCLECIQLGFKNVNGSTSSKSKHTELYCCLCWKLTELSDNGAESLETSKPALALANYFAKLDDSNAKTIENGVDMATTSNSNHLTASTEICHTHGQSLCKWCLNCAKPLCDTCADTEHSNVKTHTLWSLEVAKEQMIKETFNTLSGMSKLDASIQELSFRQRQFLTLVRNACASLQHDVQNNLDSLDTEWSIDPVAVEVRKVISRTEVLLSTITTPQEVHDLMNQLLLKQKILQEKCHQMIILCELNDLVGNAQQLFNFVSLHHAVARILEGRKDIMQDSMELPGQNPILFLANYCMSKLYSSLNVNELNGGYEDMQPSLVATNPIPATSPLNGLQLNVPNDIDVNIPIASSTTPPIPSPPLSLPPEVSSTSSVASLSSSTRASASRSVTPHSVDSPPPPEPEEHHSTLGLRNTAAAQMYPIGTDPIQSSPLIRPLARPIRLQPPLMVYPRYFFNIDINGIPKGTFVIETRPDVAPKMCKNFHRLCAVDKKMSYKGCYFFKCWKAQSVITGDFEFNNGRGSRSIYADQYFKPDETQFPAVRGAVGMRRNQKGQQHFSLVGSQFRILVQDMEGFTGIFGHVVKGIELIDKIASCGDETGKPSRPVIITKCGILEGSR